MGIAASKLIYKFAMFLLILSLVQLMFVQKGTGQFVVTIYSIILNAVIVVGSIMYIRYLAKKEKEGKARRD